MCYSTATSCAYTDRDILPSNVKPTHYDLELRPDMEKFTFTGTVKIQVEVMEATKSISLNAQELSDFDATLSINDK